MGRIRTSSVFAAVAAVVLAVVPAARCNVEQDRAECTDQLIGLATCLPYVSGESKAPTFECCSGAKQVVQKSMKCLCILVKDRDDPSLGLDINVTLALGLPGYCHAPTNLTKCIDLLQLPLNSTQAKVFVDFTKSLESRNTTMASGNVKGNSSASGSPSNGDLKSDGGERMKKSWLGAIEVVLIGVSTLFFTSPLHIFNA